MSDFLISPEQTIGILGGGQLGRMMSVSAKEMGYRTITLDPKPDSPCAQVTDSAVVKPYDDLEAAKEIARTAAVVTYEFENVALDTARYLEENSYMPQGSGILKITRNRRREKEALLKAGVQTAPYRNVQTLEDLEAAAEEIGLPAVLKTTEGGYDGKGQFVLNTAQDIRNVKQEIKGERSFVLEKWLSFEKEISVIVTRSTNGETAVFPVAENIHVNNILHHTIAPARITEDTADKARHMAKKIADSLKLVGTLAVEMFLDQKGTIYINELAPRPHNSGHYTIEACQTSQFRQHVRAICGWPLGSTKILKPAVMVNILGEHYEKALEVIPAMKNAHLHLYGKDIAKTGRKMGHITILGDSTAEALQTAAELKLWPNLKVEETV